MAVTGVEGIALLVGRVLFGGVVAFMGFNHFVQTEQMTGYAEFKGLPAPTLSVLGSGAVLVAGGLGVLAGAFPVASAVAVAAFLLLSAVTMHDFWAVPDDQRQDEMTQFLKNVALAGGAVVVAAVGTQAWAYDLGLRLL
ncbi:DoxX family protein [Halorussus marinus]|uniref:DoxX family protein n=1 Tax=Halorussus marinus TaxID=2505976 RepID=UPI00106E3335|nr:DoxX family protein [Halorussus marinus]